MSNAWGILLGLVISAAADAPKSFTVDDLFHLTAQEDVKSLADLVPKLPEEMLANHTFIANSKSLQRGRRILTFRVPKGDSKSEVFAVAIKADPTNPEHQILEVMALNPGPQPGETPIELYRLEVPASRDAKGKPIPPRKNPEDCLSCHGDNPHPIWGLYPNWPNALGAGDDELRGHEVEALAEWRKLPLVKALKPPEGSDRTPYQATGVSVGDGKFRPNARLGAVLSRVSAARLYHKIKRSPQMARYRHVLLAVALQCPESRKDDKDETKLLWRRIRAQIARDQGLKEATYSRPFEVYDGGLEAVAPILKLNEYELLLRSEEEASWGTSAHSYHDGFEGTNRYLLDLLLSDLAASDPQMRAIREDRAYKINSVAKYYKRWTPWEHWDPERLDHLGTALGFFALSPGNEDRVRWKAHCENLETRIRKDLFGEPKSETVADPPTPPPVPPGH